MEEFYLRDYLRIVWDRKFIILAVTIIALLMAIAYAALREDQHLAEAQVVWQGAPDTGSLFLMWSVETALIQRSFEDENPLMIEDVEQRLRTFRDPAAELSLSSDSETINLDLVGTDTPALLRDKLQTHIDQVNAAMEDEIKGVYETALNTVERGLQYFREKKQALLLEIRTAKSARLDSLIKQRDALRTEMATALESEAASIGATLESLESEIGFLRAEIESGYYSTESMGHDIRLADLENSIMGYELTIEGYRSLLSAEWDPLLITMEPTSFEEPVGPSMLLLIIVAGLLGLFAGVLLAFFVHYVQTPIEASKAP